jgi:uncharacterized protein
MTIKTALRAGSLASALFFCASAHLAAASEGLAAIPPRPQGYVSDYAGVIDPGVRGRIGSFAAELQKRTGAQVAVVTVRTTRPESAHSFSVRLFDAWKIGEEGKDNGALILVAVDDRQAWITTGYGIEGIIPDATANKIVREVMAPLFREGRYSEGILKASVAVISLIARESGITITGEEDSVHKAVSGRTGGMEALFTLFLFLMIFGARSGFFGYFLLGSMAGGRRRGGHWYGAGGSSGGSFGGFGGFGGGMTGGGGGGGGW